MSDVLATNLMLTGLLFLFPTISLLLGQKWVRYIIFKFLSSISHPQVCLTIIVPNWRSSCAALRRTFYVSRSRVPTSVVRILKFDNPIRSEKFQWYPNPILIRKFRSKHDPIQIRKSKTIIIPDSNHNNNFFAIFVKFSNYIGNRQAQNQGIW